MAPMMTLREYLLTTGVRQRDLAARLGVTQATVSRLASGAGQPSIELAAAIKDATGGKVGFESWVACAPPPAAPAASNNEPNHDTSPDDAA